MSREKDYYGTVEWTGLSRVFLLASGTSPARPPAICARPQCNFSSGIAPLLVVAVLPKEHLPSDLTPQIELSCHALEKQESATV
jgi:hypothetical protein